jgi:hypothetical protein
MRALPMQELMLPRPEADRSPAHRECGEVLAGYGVERTAGTRKSSVTANATPPPQNPR